MNEVLKEAAKDLGEAGARALGAGLAKLIESEGNLDDAYATMIEHLSDARLAAKKFPDGQYVPG